MSLLGEQEYRPSFIPIDYRIPKNDWIFLTVSQESLKPIYTHDRYVSDDLHNEVAGHIDKLLEDGGVTAYLGSGRRVYKMTNITNTNVIHEELNYVAGVPFGQYAKLKDTNQLPISCEDVKHWKTKLDTIYTLVEGFGTRWAKWISDFSHTQLTRDELDSQAKQIVWKIIQFNWTNKTEDYLTGSGLIGLISKSMKPMLQHYEFRKAKAIGVHEQCFEDSAWYDGEHISLIDTISSSNIGLPEPERNYQGKQKLLGLPEWNGENIKTTSSICCMQNFQKTELLRIYAGIQSLPLEEQYLLMCHFGYLNQRNTQLEYAGKVSAQRIVGKIWRNLHDRVTSNQELPFHTTNMADWLAKLDDAHIRQKIEQKNADSYNMHRLVQAVKNIPPEQLSTSLDPLAYEILQIILDNVRYRQDGNISRTHADAREALTKRLRVKILPLNIKQIINDYLLPQLNGLSVENPPIVLNDEHFKNQILDCLSKNPSYSLRKIAGALSTPEKPISTRQVERVMKLHGIKTANQKKRQMRQQER